MTRTKKATRRGFRPDLEAVEQRLVLSTLYANPLALDGAAGSLRAAIVTADNQNSGSVTILASPGTYTLTQGDIEIDGQNITIRSSGLAPAVISASAGSKIFDIEDGTVNLTNLTLKNGNNASDDEGGAIYNDATLNIKNCTFTNNYSDDYGGAIDNDATLNVSNSTFTNNDSADYGGAIYNDGIASFANSTFTGNVSGNYGGAIYSDTSDDGIIVGPLAAQPDETGVALTVTGSKFSNNTAYGFGGAIESDSGAVVISGSSFTGNTATYNQGGAIYNDDTMTINSSTFTNNATLDDDGGAVYNDSQMKINACTFTSNTTSDGYNGGAVYNDDSLAVAYSTFTSNSASGSGGYGGAIANEDTLTVLGSTFTKNYATDSSSAIENDFGSTAVISRSSFTLNTTGGYDGEALGNYSDYGDSEFSTMTLTNCVITNNDSGVYNEEYSTLNLNGCYVLGNYYDSIYNDGTTNVSLSQVNFDPDGTGTVNYNP